jgi:hypothetical protein
MASSVFQVMPSMPNLNGRESRIIPAYLGDFVIFHQSKSSFRNILYISRVFFVIFHQSKSSFRNILYISRVCEKRFSIYIFRKKLEISSRSTSSFTAGVAVVKKKGVKLSTLVVVAKVGRTNCIIICKAQSKYSSRK